MNNIIGDIFNASLSFGELCETQIHDFRLSYNDIKDELVYDATREKMLPFVAKLMLSLNIDVEFWDRTLNEYRIRNTAIKEKVEEICNALHQNGITRVWPIENFGALLCTGADIGLFASSDVDIYVGTDDKETVDHTMKTLGYKIQNADLCRSCYTDGDDNFKCNIMWEWQARINFYMPTCFDSYNLGISGGENSRLLADELMYQCLLHASVHNYIRKPHIKLYFDIGLIAELTNVNWNNVLKYAETDGYEYRVATSAYLSAKFLNAKIPESFYKSQFKDFKYKEKLLSILIREDSLSRNITTMQKLKIEAYSDNCTVIAFILRLLAPQTRYIKKKYPSMGLLRGYLHYYIDLMRGGG